MQLLLLPHLMPKLRALLLLAHQQGVSRSELLLLVKEMLQRSNFTFSSIYRAQHSIMECAWSGSCPASAAGAWGCGVQHDVCGKMLLMLGAVFCGLSAAMLMTILNQPCTAAQGEDVLRQVSGHMYQTQL